MILRSLVISILLFVLAGCGGSPARGAAAPRPLTVSAAVSLRDAFAALGRRYRERTGRAVEFNFGASGALQKQIEGGAPVDVFASAGERQMDELAAKNLIEAASRRDFAANALVLVAPADSRLGLGSFADLARADVKKIAAGNPKTVPAGQYAAELFAKAGLAETLAPKLIFAEDVRQVLDYVARGETDAGVVYASDARAAGGRVKLVATADPSAHAPIRYPIAVVAGAADAAAARDFVDFATGPEGREILAEYGFAAPAPR